MLAEGWGMLVQPRKKRGLPLAAAEDEEEPGGGEGCQCQTLIVAVCQTLGQQVKQHIDSLQRMKNRMNPETFTGFVTNQPTSLLLPLLVGPPLSNWFLCCVLSYISNIELVTSQIFTTRVSSLKCSFQILSLLCLMPASVLKQWAIIVQLI